MINNPHNPDVLSCLANLSNDEVFTPPKVVNDMLDLLPRELFASKETTFLDIGCKSGVFLREIAKRLIAGLADEIPDLQTRVDHILHKQLFGIATTELTSLVSRRTLYCSKYPNCVYSASRFDTPEGNIRFRNIPHAFVNGRCKWCGASEDQFGVEKRKGLETHAYEFIHTSHPEEIFKMKFDVIVGNPPYQLSDGGAGPSAVPLYQKFVQQAMKLSPRYLTMITPSRWFAGGKGLDEFRVGMLDDGRVREIVDFETSKDCFEGVDIAGGVSYFLWKRDSPGPCHIVNLTAVSRDEAVRPLDEFPVFIRSNRAVSILRKVLKRKERCVDSIALTQKPFGFRTYARGEDSSAKGDLRLLSSEGWGYVKRSEVGKNAGLVDRYKVIVGRLVPSNGELDVKPGEGYRVMTTPKLLMPGEINTESYVTIGTFEKRNEGDNFIAYISGRFARFMLRQAISSVNINKDVFKFVPLQDFSKPWTDAELYKKYKLTKDEIAFIESMIKPME